MNQNPANSENPLNAQNPEQQPQQPKKKVRETITLKPQHFQKQNGIQALYKAIQKTDFTKGENNVEMSMKKITNLLKTWHFEMLPKYSFQLFLQRCRALGNHKFTQAYMSKVRRIHKGEDTWGTDKPNEQEALNNLNLDNLNPNTQRPDRIYKRNEILQQKIEQANKLIQQIEKNDRMREPESRKMEIEHQNQQKIIQAQLDENDDQSLSDCEELLRQMNALEEEKKQLFGTKKHQIQTIKKEENKIAPHSDSEEVPYVPQGFDDVDFEQESSYNN